MAAECRVCTDPRRDDVHRAIDGGMSTKAAAKGFNIPRSTLQRHLAHRQTPASSPPVLAPAPPSSPETSKRTPEQERRPCLVCRSPERDAIEAALLEGQPSEAIARALVAGPSPDTVRRHAVRCIPELLRAARETRVAELATEARAKVRALAQQAEALVNEAAGGGPMAEGEESRKPGTLRERAAVLTAAKGVLELLGRITGELGPDIEIRVLELPAWAAVQETTLAALEAHPEALAAVVAAWRAMSAPRLYAASATLAEGGPPS